MAGRDQFGPLKIWLALVAAAVPFAGAAQACEPARTGPIIDVHFHLYPEGAPILAGRPNPATSVPEPGRSASESLEASVRAMARCGVVRAFALAGADTPQPDRPETPVALARAYGLAVPTAEDLARIRHAHASGRLAMIGEVSSQYAGVRPDDPRMEPLWALAEELGIPVGLHIGPAQRGVAYGRAPSYRAADSNPILLEPVLLRHPRLKIFVMHAGWPMADAMIAMLYAHPQLYVDISAINWVIPRADFHAFLRRLVDAGYSDRIMFGIDHMAWVGEIENAIAAVQDAPFLTSEQKRDIFYNNAARFFGLGSGGAEARPAGGFLADRALQAAD